MRRPCLGWLDYQDVWREISRRQRWKTMNREHFPEIEVKDNRLRSYTKCTCLPVQHTPSRSSRIISRTPVSWSRNQYPPILSIPETFRFEDFFQWCFSFLSVVSMLSSHLSFGLPLQPSALTLPLSSCHGQTIKVCCWLIEQWVAYYSVWLGLHFSLSPIWWTLV